MFFENAKCGIFNSSYWQFRVSALFAYLEVHFAESMNVPFNVYFQIINQIFVEKCEVSKNCKKTPFLQQCGVHSFNFIFQ
jgi:hypothetical protein